jgi:hypothetical protein
MKGSDAIGLGKFVFLVSYFLKQYFGWVDMVGCSRIAQ